MEPYERLSPADRRYWWWNGRLTRSARLDVIVYQVGGVDWVVEMREGGVTGFVRWLPTASEAEALATAAQARQVGDNWRPVPLPRDDPDPMDK
jgi:hypothetical protein